MKRAVFLLLLASAVPLSASDWSGSLTALGGAQGQTGLDSGGLGRLRLLAGWEHPFSPEWTAGLGILGTWEDAGKPYPPTSTLDGEENILDAESEKSGSGGRSLADLRLQKAWLGFEGGRWQFSLGRVDMEWGEAHGVRPTAVFHAERVLETFDDPPMGSDGADVSYALGANSDLEAAFRMDRGGRGEWVLRLENKGIGVSGTPLFAKRVGEEGWGAELSATLKHFQWRLEGVDWYESGAPQGRLEMVTGLYGVFREFPLGVEFLRDGMGRLLGSGATEPGEKADYLSAFVETPLFYRLRCSPTIYRSFSGGRWLVKPGFLYEFSKSFQVALDGRRILGSAKGPLGGTATQLWLSATATY